RWNIASSTLEPRLRADGSVALLADGQPSGLVIPAVMILDAGGRSVTPVGTEWSVRRAAHGWLLQLVLDDSSLPLPYTIDPSVSLVTFTGSPQTASARSNWTVGFKTGGSGALAAGDTITIVFNSGFTVPAVPAVALLSGFANCSATGTAAGTTVTITLADSGGTCTLANSASGALKVAFPTNPPAGSIAAVNWSVKTGTDTTAVNPAGAISIAAATAPSTVTFAG